MADPFVSVRGRVVVNVEALNMTESVGNYVKHRRVPVVMPETYATYFVPAVSGESIAHGYQQVLAEEAQSKGLSVCNLCSKGYFLKNTNEDVFKASFNGREPPEDANELEEAVIRGCVVEDVGGFLYAPAGGGLNVKRTSNFYVGYMIPSKESLENSVIEPQLHTRYALGTPFVEKGGRAGGQMIYYVELSSAAYTFSFDLDTKYLGKATFSMENAGQMVVSEEERKKRIGVALDTLSKFMIEMLFGAKRTRFLPIIEWESAVIAVSDDIWTVPSPFSKNYVERAEKKLEKVNYNTKLFTYRKDGGFEDVVIEAVNEAKKRAGVS
jgi:CRISPR-associated protein Csa2